MADMNLKIKIAGDTAQAEKSVSRVDKALRGLESAGSHINGVLLGMGVGLSAAGFTAFVKNGIDAADALNDLSDRTGIAVEKLSGLSYAAKIGDTDVQSLATAINKLSVNIGKGGDDFAKLGITAKDPLEAFEQLADVFSSIEDPQRRAALGNAALGKSYAEMAPLLMQGGDGIRNLVEQGQKMSGVTAEQAKAAGEFNDRLDELSIKLQSLSLVAVGPFIQDIADIAEGFDLAINKANSFTDIFSKGFWQQVGAGSESALLVSQINDVNDAINKQQIKLRAMKGESGVLSLIDDLAGYDIAVEQRKLDNLLKSRGDSLKKLDELYKPQQKPAPEKPNPSEDAINNLLGKNGDAEAKKLESTANQAAKAEATRRRSIEETIATLERDIAVSGLSADQQRRAVELSNVLKNAKGGEVEILTNLVNAKYANIDADKRQQSQWEQMISDANAYYDLRKAIGEFERSNTISNDGFNALLGQTQDLLKSGAIDENQAKAAFDRLGKAYNDGFIEPAKDGTNQLSEFGVQAARNMQTSFADFILSAGQGFDELGANFAKTVARMAAEAASAQIMNGLFGSVGQGGERNFSSGLIGTAFSAIGSAFFADGGIMTSAGPLPLRKYAGGGIANSPQLALFGEGRMNEAYVPLPDGRSIPVTMNGGGSVTVNVINNSGAAVETKERQGPNGREIEILIDKRIDKKMADAKRQGGLYA